MTLHLQLAGYVGTRENVEIKHYPILVTFENFDTVTRLT